MSVIGEVGAFSNSNFLKMLKLNIFLIFNWLFDAGHQLLLYRWVVNFVN